MSEYEVGTIDGILTHNDAVEKYVDVPEWNCKVKVKSLSKGDQLHIRQKATIKGELDASRMDGLMFVAGVVEPNFQESHLPALYKKNADGFDRVLGAIVDISGGDTSPEDAEASF